MPEYTEIDHSINEDIIAEERVEHTTPQGTQFYGVINGHEHRDISVRAITIWMWGLFCFVMVVAMSLAWLFFGILHMEERSDTIPSARFSSTIQPAPLSREAQLMQEETVDKSLPTVEGTPPLMPDPHQPIVVLRHQEDAEVSNYGYVNNAEGKEVGIHIPVADAMTLALQKGFSVSASPSTLRPPPPVSPALEPAEDKGF